MNPLLIAVVAVAVLLVAMVVVLLLRRRQGPTAPPVQPEVAGTPTRPPTEPPPPKVGVRQVEIAEDAEAPHERLEGKPPAEPSEVAPRMRDRLGKARGMLAGYLSGVNSRAKIDDQTWEELEEALIRADVGVGTTAAILDGLRLSAKENRLKDPAGLTAALDEALRAIFAGRDRELSIEEGVTNLWLFVGVNGVGKTTTIGKVARREIEGGRSVIMAAGDTFRAAAAEQLELWAQRTGADIVRGAEGGDPASVVFDAVQRGVARKVDLVLADTAGRLHTKVNLMEELKKVRRVAGKSEAAVSEVLLVLDATTGQNGLVQARQFADAVGVTGVVLTKLDGTAKGGIVVAIEKDLGIPIKLVGLGEGAADLVPFDPAEFVDAILTG